MSFYIITNGFDKWTKLNNQYFYSTTTPDGVLNKSNDKGVRKLLRGFFQNLDAQNEAVLDILGDVLRDREWEKQLSTKISDPPDDLNQTRPVHQPNQNQFTTTRKILQTTTTRAASTTVTTTTSRPVTLKDHIPSNFIRSPTYEVQLPEAELFDAKKP